MAIVITGSTNTVANSTAGGNVNVSAGLVVGNSFVQNNAVGLGVTTTTGRNAGVGTATGTLIYNSSTGTVQFYDGTAWYDANRSFVQATGGTISDYTSGNTVYRAHIFTSTGTFTVTNQGPGSVDYLVVAGGGGAGYSNAGGGGAGGLRSSDPGMPAPTKGSTLAISNGSYTITVGAGGAGSNSTNGVSGSPSTFSTITSQGGGYGGAGGSAGANGGSGGGGGNSGAAGGTGNRETGTTTPAPTQGNDGGSGGGAGLYGGGGGGGFSAAGTPGAPATPAGFGGDGISLSISGISTAYAGGGGGGNQNQTAVTPQGGLGGGGNGAISPSASDTATSGAFATGGGGGGGGNIGKPGGPGIVIIRYQIGALTATAKASGGVISYYNNKTIHTFTGSGTFTAPASFNETVEYVVIGGGGSGGLKQYISGGGGAGAYRTGTTPVAGPQAIAIQVGAGGNVSQIGPAATPASADGTSSYFGTPITAPGGGGGGTHPTGAARTGGSGGGGASQSTPSTGAPASGAPFPGTIGATPTSGWGHVGGNGSAGPPLYGPGGGGGAGGAGGNGTPTVAGVGGAGIQLPTTFRNPQSTVGAPGPTSAPTPNGFDTSGKFWVAGGGAGSIYTPGTTPGSGGGPGGPYAGGGAGAAGANGGDGGTNTGGGGGGNERDPGPATQSGHGGSGIVIIAYPS